MKYNSEKSRSFIAKARIGIAFAGIALLSATIALGQTLTTGDIAGTLTDPTGAVVPNATVTLRSTDTGQSRTVTSNGSGEYRFTTLQTGTYEVSAASPGLKSDTTQVPV